MSDPIRVAVASQEGKAVSEHFGHAKRFWIYDVEDGACRFLERREVEHYCHGQTSNQGAMAGILEAVKDCRAVFVAKIGDGPREKLAAIGVAAVSDYAWEPIEESLVQWAALQPGVAP